MDYYKQLEFNKIKSIISNYCYSEKAKDKALQLRPLTDSNDIERKLCLVDECQEVLSKGYSFEFARIVDLDKMLYHFQHRAFSFKEFRSIYHTVVKAMEIIAFIREEEQYLETAVHFLEMCDNLIAILDIKSRFERVFSPDGEVLDTASTLLKQIRKKKSSLRKSILARLDSKLKETRLENIIQDKVITQREGRYVIPLKEGGINSVPGIVHGYSGSKATIFVEPNDVVNQNNELHSLKREEEDEIYRIFCEFTDFIMGNKDEITANNVTLSELDFFFACATMGNDLHAKKPQLSSKQNLKLSNARHPLLIYSYNEIKKVIPFDLTLGDKEKLLILSGPNTGGKTITLKSVGLLTLMTLSGLTIPADEDSEIGMFADILTDISDEQSIENSLSTFSSHIEKIKYMLQKGSAETLILIDEIGSATDPEQGAALAQAILERLTELEVLGIVTTHYTPLKIFAEKSAKCINAAMQFDPDKHEPTYQFKVGLPGNSFALEIAERLGLEEDVLNRAKLLTGKKNVELTDLITTVSKQKKELAEAKYQLDLRNKLLEMKTEEYSKLIDSFEEQKKSIRQKALAEQKDYLSRAQQELNRELEKVKQTDKKQRKSQVTKLIKSVSEKQQDIVREETKLTKNQFMPVDKVKVGDEIWVKEFAAPGRVVSQEKEKVTVDINGFFFTTGKDSLFQARDADKNQKNNHKVIGKVEQSYRPAEVKTELRVRGMTYEEARPQVERFIDDGYSSGLNNVRIIHGKGAGILRNRIRKYLKQLNFVKEFYSPSEEMGGDGVTVVKFK